MSHSIGIVAIVDVSIWEGSYPLSMALVCLVPLPLISLVERMVLNHGHTVTHTHAHTLIHSHQELHASINHSILENEPRHQNSSQANCDKMHNSTLYRAPNQAVLK